MDVRIVLKNNDILTYSNVYDISIEGDLLAIRTCVGESTNSTFIEAEKVRRIEKYINGMLFDVKTVKFVYHLV